MKLSKYLVQFKSGVLETVYTSGIYNASIIASARMVENGLDRKIEFIEDEFGERYNITMDISVKKL